MARLPIPGSDDGVWGEILNDYLSQSLNPDGTLKSSAITAVDGVVISGTPSVGQVLTATSSTAADWQTNTGLALTGWSDDGSNPANVNSNGGGLNAAGGAIGTQDLSNNSGMLPDQVWAQSFGSAESYSLRVGYGIRSWPPVGVPAFSASSVAGGTVALDADGLALVNLTDLTTTGTLSLISASGAHLDIQSSGNSVYIGGANGVPLSVQVSDTTHDILHILEQGGGSVLKVGPTGAVNIQPTDVNVVPLIIKDTNSDQRLRIDQTFIINQIPPGGTFQVIDDGNNPLVFVTGTGATTLQPTQTNVDALTVNYVDGTPALHVGDNDTGSRFYLRSSVLDIFQINIDGTPMLQMDPASGGRFGIFGNVSAQQAAPSTPQGIYDGLAAYGFFASGGTIGGSLPLWFQSGIGSPVGNVNPSQTGALYQDKGSGGLYEALGGTNTDWVMVGGNGFEDTSGVFTNGGSSRILARGGGVAALSDIQAYNGGGNALYWVSNGTDGQQTVHLQLGSSGQFTHSWAADGSYTLPSAQVHGVADPTNAQDAATKNYVDTIGSPSALASGKVLISNAAGGGYNIGNSFADVDSTNITLTLTTGARRCLIIVSCEVEPSGSGAYLNLDVTVDATRQGGTSGLVGPQRGGTDNNGSFSYLTDVLSVGSHTFRLQAKSTSGTGFIYATTSFPLQFSVVELYT